jgi:glycerol-3-phosphate acyltransferase PlsY
VVSYLVLVPLSYLLGSIPFGLIVARLTKGVDIRYYGSGSTGMANVLRTAGGRAAGLVLALDMGKGILVILLVRLLTDSPVAEVVAALIAIAGHNWSVFIGFRGGRGVAIGGGALLMMAPLAGAPAAAAFTIVLLLTRIVSLGSLTAATVALAGVVATTLLGVYPLVYLVYGLLGAGIILWQHRENIQRLIQGTERRLGQPAEPLPNPGPGREKGLWRR